MHAMQEIAEHGMKPMQKQEIRVNSRDDRLTGELLVAEVIAASVNEGNVWRAFGIRIMDMTPEARDVFVNGIKAQKAAMTKNQTDAGVNDKTAKARTNSFGTRASEMTTIAKAFNAGATLEGWAKFCNDGFNDKTKHATPEAVKQHANYTTLLQYARTFSQAKAGRKADTLLVKLAKFIKANQSDDADATDTKLIEALVKVYKEFDKQ